MAFTPSLHAFVNEQIDQRERSVQTSFPAKVVSYSAAEGVVTVEPQFIEVWRIEDERIQEPIESAADAYIENVPVLFPRSGDFSITFPIAADSFGLVTCTKYSLDVWRSTLEKDPGDTRKFTMSGAVFHPVNLHPEASALSSVDNTYMILSAGGVAELVARADRVEATLQALADEYNVHTHGSPQAATGNLLTTPPSESPTGTPVGFQYTPSSVGADKVKVE